MFYLIWRLDYESLNLLIEKKININSIWTNQHQEFIKSLDLKFKPEIGDNALHVLFRRICNG